MVGVKVSVGVKVIVGVALGGSGVALGTGVELGNGVSLGTAVVVAEGVFTIVGNALGEATGVLDGSGVEIVAVGMGVSVGPTPTRSLGGTSGGWY